MWQTLTHKKWPPCPQLSLNSLRSMLFLLWLYLRNVKSGLEGKVQKKPPNWIIEGLLLEILIAVNLLDLLGKEKDKWFYYACSIGIIYLFSTLEFSSQFTFSLPLSFFPHFLFLYMIRVWFNEAKNWFLGCIISKRKNHAQFLGKSSVY